MMKTEDSKEAMSIQRTEDFRNGSYARQRPFCRMLFLIY